MRYLQNPNAPTLLSQIAEWFEKTPNQTEYVMLLDGAQFTEEEHQSLQSYSKQCEPVFKNTPFSQLNNFGLLGLPFTVTDTQKHLQLIEKYLKISSGKPVFSIVRVQQPIGSNFWYWFSNLHLKNDTQSFVLRYADSHVIPNLPSILTSKQRRVLIDHFSDWAWINRQGLWQSEVIGEQKNSAAQVPKEPLTFTNEQFQRLIEVSQIDSMYAFLQEYEIDVAKEHTNSQYDIYLYLQRLNDIMQKLRIKDSEQYYFLTLMAPYGDAFYKIPELQESWRQLKTQESDFRTVVNAWDESIWQKINASST